MNTKTFSNAMSELDTKYVEESLNYKKRAKQPVWLKWGAVAACLCLLAAGGIMFAQNGGSAVPNPDMVQIPNPIITVSSVEEMEHYLDFDIPVLDKKAESYSVFVEDSYPTMGQINYTDGSEFRMQYGSGDISGIHGGALVEQEEVEGVTVEYYQYADTAYAIWEQNGFAFSYVYAKDGSADVEHIIQQFQ